ncbi:uncharacterized protein [Dermacentor andersoni]|uniref:uncharacterized protein n=1 Tax=Dermacentor andersoni TaxID=34620 RepID=UPI0024163E9D|nr:uncharacterized protein LOC129384224 [Dermacentor andersoni]
MRTFALIACCLLAAGVRAVPIYTLSVPVVQSALQHTVIQPAAYRAAEHHSTVVEHHPGTAVVRHHPGVVESAVVHHQPVTHAVVHHAVPVVQNAVVHHAEPVLHAVLRPAVVAQQQELVYTPHHEHGYSIAQTKVTHPKSSVVEHHPLTGFPYRQTDYHHAPVVSGSRSSVHHSRPATLVQRTRTFLV